MRPLTTLNLTAGTITTAGDLMSHDQWAWINNESSLDLIVSTSLGSRQLPAGCADLFDLQAGYGNPALAVMPSALIAQTNPAIVTGTIYADTEQHILPPRGLVPLARQGQANIVNPFPLLVAHTILTPITDNAAHTVVSFTAPADGLYMLGGQCIVNSGGLGNVLFGAAYTDPGGISRNSYFGANAGGNAILCLAGSATAINGHYGCQTVIVRAKGGTLIGVVYSNSGTTPSDTAEGIIYQFA